MNNENNIAFSLMNMIKNSNTAEVVLIYTQDQKNVILKALQMFIESKNQQEEVHKIPQSEIEQYARKCPYSDHSEESMHVCALERNSIKVCPSAECICAERFGF